MVFAQSHTRQMLTNPQESSNIWVDHCEFYSDMIQDKDYYDGLIDTSHGADFITIS
jgi:pectate lyase